jgi:hypothetical protein
MPFATEGRWVGHSRTPGDNVTVGDNLGVMVVHAALLRTGEILMYSGRMEGHGHRYESWLWNPDQPINTSIKQPFNDANPNATWPNVDDLFCSHGVALEDGRLLVLGGAGAAQEGDALGIRVVYIFDPDADAPAATRRPRWQRLGNPMGEGRWYPTPVMLPDGRVVVVSGRREDGNIAASVETFAPPGYAPQTLTGANKVLPIYPGLHLVPGGRVFHSGTNWRYEVPPAGTVALEVTGPSSGRWVDHGVTPNVPDREEGTSVLLPPAQDGKILVLGGARWFDPPGRTQRSALPPTAEPRSAEILDTRASPPSWTRIGTTAAPPLNFPRINVSAVLLPDGKVLVVGGHDGFKFDPHTPSNQAEIYDPIFNTFTPAATMTDERQYHSAALLLPDGRVFVAGGQFSNGADVLTMEFYQPPYFFNPDDTVATRPTITNVTWEDGPSGQIAYGGQFLVETPNAAQIRRVVLMRPGVMTHHTDTEQRYVPLDFVRIPGTNQLRVSVVNDPSVAPPGYYMLWIVDANNRPCQRARFIRLSQQHCYVITDRSTFSKDEVAPTGTTPFQDSFYVVMDGFTPEELGISATTPTNPPPTALSPTIGFRRPDNSVVAEITATPQQLLFEDAAVPAGVRQRFTFKYAVNIAGTAPFFQADGTTPIETQSVTLVANRDAYSCRGTIALTHQPNPYMLDGQTTWLSIDLRVFKINQGETRFNRTIGSDAAAAINFIKGVLNDFNANPATGRTRFENEISTDPATSQLDLLESRGGRRVFNFAIAQVRYRGRTLNADDVRVFFRMFTTVATGLDFNRDTYRTEPNIDGDPIPVLGLQGGQIATIPFVAEPRVNTATQSMTDQRDPANRQTINATGGAETTAYFGCWLDFNQTVLRFPINPAGLGPYTTGLRSIQELIRGRHCCLVAELNFASDPIPVGATPGSNDNLSQRNLAILDSPNPGSPPTRTVQHTFEVKPSRGLRVVPTALEDIEDIEIPLAVAPEQPLRVTLPLGTGLDELMIQWGNLPQSTRVTLYVPDIGAEEILRLAALRIGPHRLEQVDDHTIACLVGDVTYVPLPGGRAHNIPALITMELPPGIKRGQTFNVVVKQVAGPSREILGTFEIFVRVSPAAALLAEEERTLAVMRHIAGSIPVQDRWYPVFERFVGQIADRVRAFGGDPDKVLPSPDDSGVPERPAPECFAPVFGGTSGLLRLLKILLYLVLVVSLLPFAWLPEVRCVIKQLLFRIRHSRTGNTDPNIPL